VLEKDGENQLERLYEKWGITHRQGGKEHHTYNETREG
jgi:hypothetical protein